MLDKRNILEGKRSRIDSDRKLGIGLPQSVLQKRVRTSNRFETLPVDEPSETSDANDGNDNNSDSGKESAGPVATSESSSSSGNESDSQSSTVRCFELNAYANLMDSIYSQVHLPRKTIPNAGKSKPKHAVRTWIISDRFIT